MTAGTTHARALDIAGASPAFRPTEDEARELHDHLRACPDCARRVGRLRADLLAIGRLDPPVSPRLHDRIREVAVTAPRSGPSPLGVALILGLLVLGVLGAAAGVGALQAARPGSSPANLAASPAANLPASAANDGTGIGDTSGDVVTWKTEQVLLAAKALWIDANGVRFTGAGTVPTVRSDPGDLTSWTLEVEWQEQGRQQRLFLYFAADASTWWVREIRTYDGSETSPKWATFVGGPWFRTPLGQAYSGALDLTGTSATGPVQLHLGGLRLAVNPKDTTVKPIDGASPPADFDLACSGILQLKPVVAQAQLLARGFSIDWRWQYSTGANQGQSEVRSSAPLEGYISAVSPGADGALVIFVEDPARPMMPAATRPPRCP